MKFFLNLSILLLALTYNGGVSGREELLLARQNNQDVTTTEASSTASPISTGFSTGATQRSSSSSTTQSSQKDAISTSSASSTVSDVMSVIVPSSTTATSSTTAVSTLGEDELPLQPRVTPALGIAGVILMMSGVALTIIGTKHKWIHIFLSTSTLISLAVTVLIIYVMDPPVSDAIQGAYLVAVVLTGLIFGAVSLIFKEVTEGLGCLLGGFCLAMWFLVLRPGGLIQSTTGCAIFIACLAVASFCLSFSRYTRNYGLIACTSFAGATITIIGVDCFSRAGLKEFWLYIWNLNDDEFPLGTMTYPITRGIRVEIAGILIICLFGVLSQLRIWKIVKERRVKRDAEQAQKDENNQQIESEIGRSIEASNERDLAHWESVYGDKSDHRTTHAQVDSAVGSSIDTEEKRSSVREREIDEIELQDIPNAQNKRESRISLRQSISKRFSHHEAGLKSPSWAAPSQENLIEADREDESGRRSESLSSSFSKHANRRSESGPVVVPLPFALPEEKEDDQDALSDKGSVEVARSVKDRRGIPLAPLSLSKNSDERPMNIPHIEHHRTYSLAATADDAPDIDMLPNPRWSMHPTATPSPSKENFDKSALFPGEQVAVDHKRLSRQTIGEIPLEENDDEALVRPSHVRENLPPIPSPPSPRDDNEVDVRSTPDHEHNAPTIVGSLHEHHLPQGLSKVAQTYRTNEWAKHITDAEKPEPDHELESTSPGIKVDPVFAAEAARPVPADILSTSLNKTEQVSRKASRSEDNPYRSNVQGSEFVSTPSTGRAMPVHAFEGSNSQAQSSKRGSNAQEDRSPSALASRGLPPSSTIPERVISPVASSRKVSTQLSVAPSTNLMVQREDRLKQRLTSSSFNTLNATPNLHLIAPSDAGSVANARIESPVENVEEDMTLAVRRAMMQQQQQPESPQQQQFTRTTSQTRPYAQGRSASQTRTKSQARSASQTRSSSQTGFYPQTRSASQNRADNPRSESRSSRRISNARRPSSRRDSNSSRPASRASQNLIYDSHQPKRSNTIDNGRQSALLSQWRQSLEQPNRPQAFTTAQVGAGLSEMQRQVEARREFLEREREKREMKREEAMRGGVMHDAHRDKLRKMQAKAAEAEKQK